MKGIKTILTLLIAMVALSGTAMATLPPAIIAHADGSATGGSGPNAESEAHVLVDGVLTWMTADVRSTADGSISATSTSGAYGILFAWEYAEVGGYTVATAVDDSPATASADADTYGKVKSPWPLTYTDIDVGSDAEGASVSVGAGVMTVANGDIFDESIWNPGVMSTGYADAAASGASEATVSGVADAKAFPTNYPYFSFAAAETAFGAGEVSYKWASVDAFAVVAGAPPIAP